MEGKKRYVALVLFLLIGLTLFAFANPSEEQKGSGNKNGNGKDTTEVSDKNTDSDTDGTLETETTNQNQTQVLNQQPADNTYAYALAAIEQAEKVLADELADVDSETLEKLLEEARDLIKDVTSNTSKAELTERADVVEEALDAIALVAALEELVETAENKEGIIEANDYRTDNQVRELVENLRNEEVQEVLEDILEELNLILDDETAPSYDGIKDNETTKEDVTLTVTDETEVEVTVTLNGEEIEYKEGNAFTEEGIYEVTLVDEAFNETTITFTIDKTAPVVTLKGKNKVLEPGHYTYDLYAYIEDASEYVALLNGEAYVSGTKIGKRANYTLVVTDIAGNETTIEFAIDKDKPKVTGVKDGASYNTAVTPEITDKNLDTVTLNGEEFVSGTEVSEEGVYTLIAKDKAGNKTTVTFTIDKTKAELVSANMYTNGNKYTEEKNTIYYATKGNTITAYIRVNEQLKNVPVFTFEVNGVTYVAKNVTESFHNANDEVNGIYKYQTTVVVDELSKEAEGKVKITVSDIYDKAGNETADVTGVTNKNVVIVDRVGPKPHSTTYSPKTLTNGDVTVTIKVSEALLEVEGWTLSEDKKSITKTFSKNVNGNVKISDLAGNKVTRYYSIKNIDKVAPTGTVTTSNNNGNWSTNKDVTATLKTDEKIVTPEGWTVVTEGYEFTKVYSENEKVTLEITDLAGNKATVKFEVKRIDKVAPVVTVIDPNKYQIEVHSEYVDKGYSAYDKVDKDVTNRIKITYQFQAKGTSTWPFVDELDTSKLGTYKVIYTATDKAGNSAKGTRVVEIVDTTAPLLTLNGESKITLEAGIDTYEELGATATDNYDGPVENIQPAFIHYRDANNKLEKVTSVDTTKVGTYKIVYEHKDSSNNIGVDANRADHKYVMRTVVVQDTTAPVVTANLDKNGNKDITLEAGVDTYNEPGATVTDNVDETYQLTAPSYINHYTLDGKYTGRVSAVDTTVLGKYLLVYMVEDSSKNVSNNQLLQSKRWVIVKDTINPTLTVKKESVGTEPYYSQISFSLSDSNKIDYFEVNGTKFDRTDAKYSDANYGNIKSALVAGENTMVLYDTAGNKTEKTFYMDWTAPTIGVKNWYGENPYRGADFKLSDNYAIDYLLVNGTKYDRTNSKYSDANYQNIKNSLVDGENTIILYDAAGNKAEYTFTFERTAPTYSLSEGTEGTGPYKKLNLKLHDPDGIISVVINGTQLPHTGYYVDINDGHAYTFIEGTNTVVATDKAGNSVTYTFEVDRTHYVTTMDDLKAAFAAGGKITLQNDIEVTEMLTLVSGKELVLDMNGHKLTISDTVDPMMDIKKGSKLTITGNGTFDLEEHKYASLMYPRGEVIIENGNFLRETGSDKSEYGSFFVGISGSGGAAKIRIYGGYFDGGYYKEGDEFNNSRTMLNGSWGQDIKIYGGTFVGQNPAYGDEGMAYTNPNSTSTYCQTIFFEGQSRLDTEIPEAYTVTKGTHADGRPTFTVTYTPSN